MQVGDHGGVVDVKLSSHPERTTVKRVRGGHDRSPACDQSYMLMSDLDAFQRWTIIVHGLRIVYRTSHFRISSGFSFMR